MLELIADRFVEIIFLIAKVSPVLQSVNLALLTGTLSANATIPNSRPL